MISINALSMSVLVILIEFLDLFFLSVLNVNIANELIFKKKWFPLFSVLHITTNCTVCSGNQEHHQPTSSVFD